MPDELTRRRWSRLVRALGAILAALTLAGCVAIQPPPVDPLHTPTANPLIPTPPSAAVVAPGRPGATPEPRPVGSAAPSLPVPGSLRWRVGVGVPHGRSPAPLPWPAERPGFYLNWSVGYTETVWAATPMTATLTPDDWVVPPDATVGMAFVPLVWVAGAEVSPPLPWLAATVAQLPGRTWLIGNEPDVKWQGNATPDEYAQAYHAAYTTIKAADPTAQVAIGGVSQVTPLRLRYLEAVWTAYAARYGGPLPVDVWTMHAFVLQERAGDWGVDVPPGLDATSGEAWTIEQHDDLTLVAAQVRRMRAWMAAHGQRAKPLWVTEYGILMPAAYGFDEERVRRFLLGSFDLFATLTDAELGDPADGGRLVQRWVWFSMDDALYPTGNLFTLEGYPTGVMAALAAYLREFGD